jgi:hypothetical protein
VLNRHLLDSRRIVLHVDKVSLVARRGICDIGAEDDVLKGTALLVLRRFEDGVEKAQRLCASLLVEYQSPRPFAAREGQ